MQASFIRGVSFFFVLNILIKPIWIFGIDMVVQNRVGPEIYGEYFAVLNLTLMFAVLLDAGINMSNTRNVAGETGNIGDFFPSLVGLRFSLLILFLLVVGSIGIVLGYDSKMMGMLAWLGFNQFLLASVLFVRSYVGGLRWFSWDAFLSIADKVFMVLVVGYFLYFQKEKTFQIEYLIAGQTAAYFLALSTGLGVIRRELGKMQWLPKIAVMRKKLREALPYATLILLMGLYTRMDGVMIERISGKEASGMYAGAFRLLDIAIQMGVLFSFVLIPIITRKIQQKAYFGTLMRSSFNLLLSISLSAVVISVFFKNEIIHLFYLHATPRMSITFAVLMCTLPAFYMGYLFGSALTAGGQTRILNRIAIGGLIINFFLNIIAISLYGELGAAVTTLITQWLAALLQMIAAKRIYNIKIAKIQWASLVAMMFTQYGVYLAASMVFRWEISLVIGGIFALSTPFLFKLVLPSRLVSLRQ